MKKRIKYSFIAFILFDLIAAAIVIGYLIADSQYWKSPIANQINNTEILIEKGASFADIVDQLEQQKIIEHPILFKIFAYSYGEYGKYIAGYYKFEPYSTPSEVSQKLSKGEVEVFAITFPEGWLSQQIAEKLMAETHLFGEINEIPSEGSLMPSTYHFNYGQDRAQIIRNMQAAMAKTLDEEWAGRAADLPYKNKEEALIMASIIERETGVASERQHIAAVFVNRLRKRMRLQSDPTANYGIYKESGQLKTQLSPADIGRFSVYNTYMIDGLPATPICNMGRASLNAALHPADSDDLYFVANGEGGHNFASNLAQHNINVNLYRQKMKLKMENTNEKD